MSAPARKRPPVWIPRRRIPLCFCEQCCAANAARAALKEQAINSERLADLRRVRRSKRDE